MKPASIIGERKTSVNGERETLCFDSAVVPYLNISSAHREREREKKKNSLLFSPCVFVEKM